MSDIWISNKICQECAKDTYWPQVKEENMSLNKELQEIVNQVYDLERSNRDLLWRAEFHEKFWELGKVLRPGIFTNSASEVLSWAKVIMAELESLRTLRAAQDKSIAMLDVEKHALLEEVKVLKSSIQQEVYEGHLARIAELEASILAKNLKIEELEDEAYKAKAELNSIKNDVKNGEALSGVGISRALEEVKHTLAQTEKENIELQKKVNNLSANYSSALKNQEEAEAEAKKWIDNEAIAKRDEFAAQVHILESNLKTNKAWADDWYRRFWEVSHILGMPGTPSYQEVLDKVQQLTKPRSWNNVSEDFYRYRAFYIKMVGEE
jgi:hypothetical protein